MVRCASPHRQFCPASRALGLLPAISAGRGVWVVGILAVLIAAEGRPRRCTHPDTDHPDSWTGVVPVDEQEAPEPLPFDEFQPPGGSICGTSGNPEWPLEKINPQTKEKGDPTRRPNCRS